MKRRDLLKLLEQNGWEVTPGAKHDMARNPKHPGKKIPIPRHTEIEDRTVKSILKGAGL